MFPWGDTEALGRLVLLLAVILLAAIVSIELLVFITGRALSLMLHK
jgi:hypothetical protein